MGNQRDYMTTGKRADKGRMLTDRQFRSLKAVMASGDVKIQDIERRFGRSIAWLRRELAAWEERR